MTSARKLDLLDYRLLNRDGAGMVMERIGRKNAFKRFSEWYSSWDHFDFGEALRRRAPHFDSALDLFAAALEQADQNSADLSDPEPMPVSGMTRQECGCFGAGLLHGLQIVALYDERAAPAPDLDEAIATLNELPWLGAERGREPHAMVAATERLCTLCPPLVPRLYSAAHRPSFLRSDKDYAWPHDVKLRRDLRYLFCYGLLGAGCTLPAGIENSLQDLDRVVRPAAETATGYIRVRLAAEILVERWDEGGQGWIEAHEDELMPFLTGGARRLCPAERRELGMPHE